MSHRSLMSIALLFAAIITAYSPASADKARGRGSVKDFEFSFRATPRELNIVSPVSVCVLPVINTTDLERHTKNIDKALRNMTSEEATRVLGIRYNAYGKPLNRFLTAEPFEVTIQRALEDEMAALGLAVVSSTANRPPANLRERTLASLVDTFEGGEVPDILLAVEIEDFFFETTTGFAKLKMETFFSLEVAVLDTNSREIVWEDTIQAGDLDKKAMYMGKTAVETRLDVAFQDLIENVLRNNKELQGVLQDL